jgi:hypothetical protein
MQHGAELQSEYHFILGIYYGSTAYSVVGLGGAALVSADVLPESYASLVLAGQRAVVATAMQAPYITWGTYTGIAGAVSGGVANPAIHQIFTEIVEFEVGNPGRGIPGLGP